MASDEDSSTSHRFRLSPLLASSDFPPASATVRADFAARSQRGRLRAVNEDHYLVLRLERGQETLLTSLPDSHAVGRFEERGYAMIVADGMGETGAGEIASRIAVASLVELAVHFGKWQIRVDPAVAQDVMARLEHFYRQISGALVLESASGRRLLRTTLTAAVSGGRDLFFAHLGHSRAYLYRKGELIQITKDHTLHTGRDPTEANQLPAASVTSDLEHAGSDTTGAGVVSPGINIERFGLRDRDVVLLCTSGLTNAVPDEAIARVLGSNGTPDEQCDALIAAATAACADDDATVVVGHYHVPVDTEGRADAVG